MGVSRVPGGEWSSAHSNGDGLARLFRSSYKGVHTSDKDNSVGKQERTASSLTLPREGEADRRGRAHQTMLRKDRRQHASDPSLVGSENWEEETGDAVGEGRAHTRADSPWEGSYVKVSCTTHVEVCVCMYTFKCYH